MTIAIFFAFFLTTVIGSMELSEDFLRAQFPLFGISETAADLSAQKSVCSSQLKSLYFALKKRETWALRMLDSSGVPENGFIWGNNYWLGAYSQCKWVSSKRPIYWASNRKAVEDQPRSNFSRFTEFPPFGVYFYIASFKHYSRFQVKMNTSAEDSIFIGLCMPSSCSSENLEPLLSSWSFGNPLEVQRLYNFTMKFQRVRSLSQEVPFADYPLAITVSVFLGLITVAVVIGTLYDVYVWTPKEIASAIEHRNETKGKWESGKVRNIHECDELLQRDNNFNDSYELKIDNSLHKSIPVPIRIPQIDNQPSRTNLKTVLERFIVCFSVAANSKAIVDTGSDKNDVPSIHGLRFIGMIWIIYICTIYYLKDFADNKPLLLRTSRGFSEQVIGNSSLSVDTLFFSSGFLLSYVYYKNRRSSTRASDGCSLKLHINEFCIKLIMRLIRLTPVYSVVLALATISIRRINRMSIFETSELPENICDKYWWRNLLYINNLFKPEEMCMPWSWYISAEMQFFMLAMILLITSSRCWKLAAILTGSLIAITSVLNGYLSYSQRAIPVLSQHVTSLHSLHYSPWTRLAPYLMGTCTGYFSINLKGKFVFNKATLTMCWIVGLICNVWALFGLYDNNMSVISITLYSALSRPAWGFGLSWIVVACATGNAGILNGFLSFRGWILMSKLSLMAYILGPLAINLIYSSSEAPIDPDFFPMAVYFVGFTGITYVSSTIFSLILEIPFSRLGKWLIGQRHLTNQLN